MSDQPLSPDQVRKVAQLARLALSDEQVELYRHQLGGVLAYMHRLSGLDLSGIEPMASPLDLTNRLADDQPGTTLTNDQLMAIAPGNAAAPPFIAVPKVIGEAGGAGA